MSSNQRALVLSRTRDGDTLHAHEDDDDDDGDGDGSSPAIREIHALTTPPSSGARRRETWETGSHRSSPGSMASSEINFTSISREFNALVLAGSNIASENETGNLGRIGEEENLLEETNPLAIVPDTNPLQSPGGDGDRALAVSAAAGDGDYRINGGEVSVQNVKKEEVLSKISAWQNAKIAKINNRFKREDVVIKGWEGEQVQKATSWMKKEERKLEEKRAKALEKMQNDIAEAHRKAEERRASAEAKRGTKVARILEIANLMKAVGRLPAKRSCF
ncbi:remorin 4.1-like [Primulina tabacum]|uniref:remorin 4.1-like n=1 Tax=Primulina tabacum TaxID=48773 RepID=UPI003F59097A